MPGVQRDTAVKSHDRPVGEIRDEEGGGVARSARSCGQTGSTTGASTSIDGPTLRLMEDVGDIVTSMYTIATGFFLSDPPPPVFSPPVQRKSLLHVT